MAGEAVLPFVPQAPRANGGGRFVAVETPRGVETSAARAGVLVGIVAGEAGELSAGEKAAARREPDRLEAHSDWF